MCVWPSTNLRKIYFTQQWNLYILEKFVFKICLWAEIGLESYIVLYRWCHKFKVVYRFPLKGMKNDLSISIVAKVRRRRSFRWISKFFVKWKYETMKKGSEESLIYDCCFTHRKENKFGVLKASYTKLLPVQWLLRLFKKKSLLQHL